MFNFCDLSVFDSIGKELDTPNSMLLVSDTTRTQESSAPSHIEEIVSSRQVRDIMVMRGNNSKLPLVASKHSRKSSLSMLNSLKFWKRKSHKLATNIDYLSMLNLNQSMDGSKHLQTRHTPKQYRFSLKI